MRQERGSIAACAVFRPPNSPTGDGWAFEGLRSTPSPLARLLPDSPCLLEHLRPPGTSIRTFSGDGKQTTFVTTPSRDFGEAVARQSDGKLVVAGTTDAGNLGETNFAVARYNDDGTLDTAFSGDGLLTTDFANDVDFASDLAIQSDGKIVVVGSGVGTGGSATGTRFALARYNANGSLDTSFGGGDGLVMTQPGFGQVGQGTGVAIQPDGKIVTAGTDFADFVVMRHNADGSLDTTFSGDGITKADLAAGDRPEAVAIQTDGRIVVAGDAIGTTTDAAVARFNSDGTPDTTFSGDGELTFAFLPSTTDSLEDLAIQSDGKIVTAGSTISGTGVDFAVARINVDGTFDTAGFGGGDGLQTTNVGSADSADAVAIQTDGKIVAAGGALNPGNFAIVRYNTDGSLDTTNFGSPNGFVTTDLLNSDGAAGLLIDPAGKLVAAGVSDQGGDPDFALVRYNSNGSLDTATFGGGDGKQTTPFGVAPKPSSVKDTAIQSDGKIVVVGDVTFGSEVDFALARYNADGTLDTAGFGGGDGIATTDIDGPDRALAVAIQSNGKIVVAGSSAASAGSTNTNTIVVRYNADGSLDTGFGGGDGIVTTDVVAGTPDFAADVALQSDGMVVTAGSIDVSAGNSDIVVLRYTTAGVLDTAGFGGGDGIVTTDIGGFDAASALAIQSDGKIVAAGKANGVDFAITRYLTSGSPDTATFGGGDGIVTTDINGTDTALDLAMQTDGRLVAAGESNTAGTDDNIALARYAADGSPDNAFSGDGKLETDINNDDAAAGVALESGGKIVVVGPTASGTVGSPDEDFAVLRYTSGGGLDPDFDIDGIVTTAFGSPGDEPFAVAIQPSDGKIVAAGEGSAGPAFALARYLASGPPRRTLAVSAIGNGTVTGPAGIEGNGINCPGDCTETYLDGAAVSLSATAGSGSAFTSWGGDCSGSGNCNLTMTTNRAVTATFTLQRDLTVTPAGSGVGTVTGPGINCGDGNMDCDQNYDNGTIVTLTAAPGANSTFAGWSGACSGTGTCQLTMDQARSVTATFGLIQRNLVVTNSGFGFGSVTSDPAGIDCPTDCDQNYDHGTVVTLTATPETDSSTFTGWGGDCSGTGTCQVTMDQARSVTATFALIPRNLSVTKSGSGSGSVSSSPAGIDCGTDCDEDYDHGTLVTLDATPDATSSTFSGWSGACSGTGNCQVTMDEAQSVTATFDLAQRALTVTNTGSGVGTVTGPGINCGDGNTDCAQSYDHGTLVTLNATPDSASSAFSGWSGGGCTGTGACEVTMDEAQSVTATFDLVQRVLSVARSGSGSGSVGSSPVGIDCGSDCAQNYDNGTIVTLTAAPGANSTFTGWSGGGCSGTGTCQLTMDQVRSVTATFGLVKRTLAISVNGPGRVTSNPAGVACPPDCVKEFDHGVVVTLTPTPGANSRFTGWSGACSGTGACQVTLDQARSVAVAFSANPPPPRCGGKSATKFGSARADVLRGTPRADVIAGLGGNDTIRGLGGNDILCGGAGRDRLFGGAGKDRLLGQGGADKLRGGPGRDVLRGGPGKDSEVQ